MQNSTTVALNIDPEKNLFFPPSFSLYYKHNGNIILSTTSSGVGSRFRYARLLLVAFISVLAYKRHDQFDLNSNLFQSRGLHGTFDRVSFRRGFIISLRRSHADIHRRFACLRSPILREKRILCNNEAPSLINV